ncbi:MAG: DHHW family protein [Oscillospiraceae bacterium]
MNKRFYEQLTVALFTLALFEGCVLSQILPLRPSYSEEEKRELAKFPAFSLSSLADGSYFRGVSLWFSDTFPFREELVELNSLVESLHGSSPIQISGSVEQGDDIPDPDAPDGADNPEPEPEPEPEKDQKPFQDDDGIDENYTDPEDPGAVQKFGAVLQVGDTAYEYYGFSESAAKSYAGMVNSAAALLGENVQVYTMVVPNSMGVMLPDSLRDSVKTSDQEKAIDYIYSQMSERVQTVPIYATLRSHRSEYIYYRTDHHWTALGAYYAYTKLASLQGWDAWPLSQYTEVNYGDFLGSFYSSTGKSAALKNNPDQLIAYLPFYEYDFVYWDRSGSAHNSPMIQNVSNWAKSSKYSAFICGDQPYEEIENHAVTDGSACVILKESYGNAFVPFLAAHYQHTYVVDYRYWDGALKSLVEGKGVKDVYFVNNIMAAQTNVRINEMKDLLK